MENNDEKKPVFKTPNDIHTVVKVDDKQTVLDETGCTTISIILKNSGDIATSFLGAHNPDIIRVLEKATKRYLKNLKKELKNAPNDENIEVKKDTPNPLNTEKQPKEETEKPKSKTLKTKANKIAKEK